MSKSVEGVRLSLLRRRLVLAAARVRATERRLERERASRDRTICALLRAGESERAVAEVAGISGPAVHNVKHRAARRAPLPRDEGRRP